VPDWKKEISFGRKQKAEPKPASDAVPFWKKEIGGRKKAAGPAKPKSGPAKPKSGMAKPDGAVPFWKRELGGKKKRQVDAPAVAAEPVAAAVPEPAPAPVAETEDLGWLTARLDAFAPAADAAAPALPAPWPPPSEDTPAAAPWPPPSDELPTPTPTPAPAPIEAAAPAPVTETRVPFWKKELGKPKAPKASRSPKPPKPDAGESVPFWKRELGRGKLPKGEQRAKAEKPSKDDGVPFWKRELGKGKAPKGEKRAKAEKPPKGAGVPFWKRELGGGSAKPKAVKDKDKSITATTAKKTGTVIGLKIGASQIAAARVSNSGEPQLLQVAREPLEDGVVVGGELRDVEALAEALKRFFTRHKLPKKGVRLGIANNRIGVRTFEISGIDDPRQLANAIRFRAQETLPIPLDEAVLDWQVLRESTDEAGTTTRRVLLVVAYRELVDRYVLACRKAGIRLDGIDLEAFAMLRALTVPAGETDAPPGAQVVVSVGHDRSTFAVSDGRICEFTRVLSWGGQSLNVAIARGLDMTPSEAAPIKHAMSLVDDTVALEGLAPEREAAACAAVRAELQSFARELVSSLRFYQNQPDSLGIAELMMTGGTADLPGLTAELERLIGVGVRIGDPLARVRVGKKIRDDTSPNSLAIAIGLGIED
jgi:type IV pilus assembly protein PilM